MSTPQPTWKLIDQLGDVDPITYGGYFIYQDTTGVYEEEAEYLYTNDCNPQEWWVYRFMLDRLKMVEIEGVVYLIPLKYDNSWPHPVQEYDEWFNKDIKSIADFSGISVQELREGFCSDNPRMRAFAYQTIGQYHGYENLDINYPLHFTKREEVEERYKDDLE